MSKKQLPCGQTFFEVANGLFAQKADFRLIELRENGSVVLFPHQNEMIRIDEDLAGKGRTIKAFSVNKGLRDFDFFLIKIPIGNQKGDKPFFEGFHSEKSIDFRAKEAFPPNGGEGNSEEIGDFPSIFHRHGEKLFVIEIAEQCGLGNP